MGGLVGLPVPGSQIRPKKLFWLRMPPFACERNSDLASGRKADKKKRFGEAGRDAVPRPEGRSIRSIYALPPSTRRAATVLPSGAAATNPMLGIVPPSGRPVDASSRDNHQRCSPAELVATTVEASGLKSIVSPTSPGNGGVVQSTRLVTRSMATMRRRSSRATRTLPSGRKANGAKAPGHEESFRPEAVSQEPMGVASEGSRGMKPVANDRPSGLKATSSHGLPVSTIRRVLWTCPSQAPRFHRTVFRNPSASSGAVSRASSIQSRPRSAWPSWARAIPLSSARPAESRREWSRSSMAFCRASRASSRSRCDCRLANCSRAARFASRRADSRK